MDLYVGDVVKLALPKLNYRYMCITGPKWSTPMVDLDFPQFGQNFQ